MIIMGVDFGDARTGLAVCDKGEMLASPAGVISEKDFTQCQEKVAAAAKEHRAELLVVGYPKNMNGTVGELSLIHIYCGKSVNFSEIAEKHWTRAGKCGILVKTKRVRWICTRKERFL